MIPNAGGLDVVALRAQAALVRPSQRRRVMVKGYSGFVGLARVALEALEESAPYLRDFEICIYSASFETALRAHRLRKKTGLSIRVIRKGRATHNEMLELFSGARFYLGLSLSDGISTSLLEAIACGCFPIQTATACADEWIDPDVTGIVLNGHGIPEVAEAIRVASTDDTLVDRSFDQLMRIAASRLSADDVGAVARDYYVRALA